MSRDRFFSKKFNKLKCFLVLIRIHIHISFQFQLSFMHRTPNVNAINYRKIGFLTNQSSRSSCS